MVLKMNKIISKLAFHLLRLITRKSGLNEILITDPELTFLFEFDNDSMKDAGIYKGSVLITGRSKTPKSGNIIVATIENEFTAKFFKRLSTKFFLFPPTKIF